MHLIPFSFVKPFFEEVQFGQPRAPQTELQQVDAHIQKELDVPLRFSISVSY